MTREEILLEALAASMERERAMAERVIEMEERLEGFEPEPRDEGAFATLLDRYGMKLDTFRVTNYEISRRFNAPTLMRVEMCEYPYATPDFPYVLRPGYRED